MLQNRIAFLRKLTWGFLIASLAGSAWAGRATPAQVQVSAASISFNAAQPFKSATLTVAGPQGLSYRGEVGAGDYFNYNLVDQSGGALSDGSYQYQLIAIVDEAGDDGEEANVARTSGSFTIVEGSLVTPGSVDD